MFFKIVRNFKAKIGPFLLTLFLAPGYVHANTWEINVTRKDSNLYQITGKDSFVNTKEGANKQVISSQADSLIKISRIWADFFPANTSNQPI